MSESSPEHGNIILNSTPSHPIEIPISVRVYFNDNAHSTKLITYNYEYSGSVDDIFAAIYPVFVCER